MTIVHYDRANWFIVNVVGIYVSLIIFWRCCCCYRVCFSSLESSKEKIVRYKAKCPLHREKSSLFEGQDWIVYLMESISIRVFGCCCCWCCFSLVKNSSSMREDCKRAHARARLFFLHRATFSLESKFIR